ncbi:DUF4198 domain-containing protein [bacterium]|nr:DUF4198 domain-containing protein [bacterium]
MNQIRVLFVGWLVMVSVVGSSAWGHFVWIEVDQQEGKILARSSFGEHGSWDPDYADRVKTTAYQIRSAKVAEEAISLAWDPAHEWLSAEKEFTAAGAISGKCVWGLFGKSADNESLLTFYPKAMFGPASDWKEVGPSPAAALEMIPSATAEGIAIIVLAEGKPLADAKLKLYAPGATSSQPATTDSAGRFVWKITEPGRYAIAVVHRTKASGTYEGKTYQGQMQAATLTFAYPASAGK